MPNRSLRSLVLAIALALPALACATRYRDAVDDSGLPSGSPFELGALLFLAIYAGGIIASNYAPVRFWWLQLVAGLWPVAAGMLFYFMG